MNPKVSISVDSKNKAIATITGMLTVGAKVDVEITGLPTGIEDWAATDKFVGKSLRFRIVDEMGRDLVRYPLIEKDTTSLPPSDGDKWSVDADNKFTTYSGCFVNCDTDCLRRVFHHIPFNETMELGLILDSIVDSAQFATGRIKVRQWAICPTEDPTVLPDWRETLAKLTVDLASVDASKTAAAASATQASTYADNASTSAISASASASAASGSEGRAAAAIRHYPQVGLNGNWYVWDVDSCQFVDSGKSACGYASWFFDSSDNKYHKVVITVNSLGEHCISVDQDGVSSVPAGDQYVDLSTNQTIGGDKTFTSSRVEISNSQFRQLVGKSTVLDISQIPSSDERVDFVLKDKNNVPVNTIYSYVQASTGHRRFVFRSCGNVSNQYIDSLTISVAKDLSSADIYGISLTGVHGSAFAAVGMPSVTSLIDFSMNERSSGDVLIQSTPTHGWFNVRAKASSIGGYIRALCVLNNTIVSVLDDNSSDASFIGGSIPIPKGSSLSVYFSGIDQWHQCGIKKANAEVS